MDRAAAFLRAQQRENGQLRGFMLLPGTSTEWLTAHVAFVLEGVRQADDICRRAADYLARVLESRGACGFNARVGRDCDSTAQALLAVHRFGMPLPGAALDYLLWAQTPEGGVPTYASDGPALNGWQVAHPDVTAIVLLALKRLNAPADRVRKTEAWLDGQAEAGLITAYWWPHPAYALWAQSRAGYEIEAASRAAAPEISSNSQQPFLGMLMAAANHAGRRHHSKAVATILEGQLGDGSWPCAPCLRVTDPRSDLATAASPGSIHADLRRVFSTAHALAALNQIEQLEPGVGATHEQF
jgi:hypothetical protein